MIIGPHRRPILKLTGEDHKEELESMLHAALEYYDGKLDNTELPIELGKVKLAK